MIETHILTVNNKTELPMSPEDISLEDIQRWLHNLNGADDFAMSFAKLPEGEHTYREREEALSDNYMQSAGSADALSIEIRRTRDGVAEQYAVGRIADPHTEQPNTAIFFGNKSTHVLVYDNEVFSADEAAPIYLAYYETGDIPSGYALRELDVTAHNDPRLPIRHPKKR